MFIIRYFWNVIKSIAAIGYTIAALLWKRIFILLYHILSAPVFFLKGLYNGIKILFSEPSRWLKWFLRSLPDVLIWAGRAIAKALDVILLGEWLDLVFQILKPNQRTMNDTELAEAKKVFGDSIQYWQVRIDEFSLLAKFGAWWAGTPDMGVTTFHTVNFTNKISAAPGNLDMRWLIHELAHIRQMETAGLQYLIEALVAQNTATGYRYGGPARLAGADYSDFNREQQAEIAADYYSMVLYGDNDEQNFKPLIEEMNRPGRLFS